MLLFENVSAYIALLGWEETFLHLNQMKIYGQVLISLKNKNTK